MFATYHEALSWTNEFDLGLIYVVVDLAQPFLVKNGLTTCMLVLRRLTWDAVPTSSRRVMAVVIGTCGVIYARMRVRPTRVHCRSLEYSATEIPAHSAARA